MNNKVIVSSTTAKPVTKSFYSGGGDLSTFYSASGSDDAYFDSFTRFKGKKLGLLNIIYNFLRYSFCKFLIKFINPCKCDFAIAKFSNRTKIAIIIWISCPKENLIGKKR